MRLFCLYILFISTCALAQNGELKTDFGQAGKLTFDLDDLDNPVGILTESSGSSIIYGNTSDNQGGIYPFDYFFMRLDAYGNQDLNFGNSGVSRGDFPGFTISSIREAVLHNSGIYFLGQGINTSNLDTFALFLGKLNLDETLDQSFADNGFFTADFLGSYNTAGSLIIDSSDKIVFCGSTTDDQGTLVEYPLIGRLNLNGTPDSTFGNTGFVVWNYYQGTLIDAMNIPPQYDRHGDGAYLNEIVEINNNYFLTGKFVGTAFSQLHVMCIGKDGDHNPNFISQGPQIFQIDPGYNHFVSDVAFDGELVFISVHSEGLNKGDSHLIQTVDTTGVLGDVIEIEKNGFDLRTNFLQLWNDKLFVGGYSLDNTNQAPGYHSDEHLLYVLDEQQSPISIFDFDYRFTEDGEEGTEAIGLHSNYGLTVGYFNNEIGDNHSDMCILAFNLDQNLIEKELDHSFEIFPNPTTEFIRLEGFSGHYEIFSLSGTLIESGSCENQLQIGHLQSGTYILHLKKTQQKFRFAKID